jgi:hypothetical protein
VKKARLMIVDSELHNSTWVEAIEDHDAVVVTDELRPGANHRDLCYKGDCAARVLQRPPQARPP